ncbi:MAG: DUF2083 domain-containing protein [Rhodobacterales bacterium]|nr:DUF2083 domain-containing protein [Rhodobacterales bacterium]
MVYSDGIDLTRRCERLNCEQRVLPSLRHPLQLDENARGVGFYASVHGD